MGEEKEQLKAELQEPVSVFVSKLSDDPDAEARAFVKKSLPVVKSLWP